MFDESWPVVDSWQLFAQWKDASSGTGSPPIAMLAGSWSRDRITLSAAGWPGGGSPESHDLGPLIRGRWIDWLVHITFSTRQDTALVEVWRDGTRVASVRGWRPSFNGEPAGSDGATLRAGRRTYLKIGIYRDPAIHRTGRLWTDNWMIARPG
jgi:hypothetical protein